MKPTAWLALLLTSLTTATAAHPEHFVVERGPHFRVNQSLQQRSGKPVSGSFVELQAGLHYFENGQWRDTEEVIEVTPQGAVARKGPHKVIFPPNLNVEGAIDLLTPDNVRLRSHVLGLCYRDMANGKRVVIGAVKDSQGELLMPNRVIYRDAFQAVTADVLYTYTKGGFEQDIILRQNPPSPVLYGLNPATTQLEVLTEFINPPAPRKQPRALRGGWVDEHLDFGAMHMGEGRAFLLAEARPGSLPVIKSWQKIQGRDLLIESVYYPSVKPYLDRLVAAAPLPKRDQEAARTALASTLPKLMPARKEVRPIQLASAPTRRWQQETSVVIDYQLLSSASGFTFQGDTTYYVSGTVNLTGTTTIEGGAVVKFTNDSSAIINVSGPVICKTGSYRPAVFTAKDDNSIGAAISGSSGSPSGYYAEKALSLSSTNTSLQGLRVSYARKGIEYTDASEHTLTDIQMTLCQNGLLPAAHTLNVRNGLFYSVLTNFLGNSFTGKVEHATFHLISQLAYDSTTNSTLNLTNSLLVSVTNQDTTVTYDSSYTSTVSSDAGVFQTVGGGSHYLATASSYRDAGTTTITTSLLTAIKQKTTYPPYVYSQGYVTNDVTLLTYAARDGVWPDLGYHYDAIDYAMGWMVVTNSATVRIPAGTVVATFSPTNSTYGLLLTDGTTLDCQGTPTQPARIVRYHTAQEQATTNWICTTADPGILTPSWNTTNPPTLRFRFTEWYQMADGGDHFQGKNYQTNMTAVSFRDCRFNSAGIASEGTTISLTNCLLERVETQLTGTSAIAPYFMNNLFYGGSVLLTQGTNATCSFYNNLFDTVTLAQTNAAVSGYNGYLSTSALTGSGGGDVTLTNADYQVGALGNYYLPTNSTLINVGSVTNAGLAGFYHYTTTTNQTKEGVTQLDIGLHYVAVDANGNPVDTDGDGEPDYVTDANGNGSTDSGELNWALKVFITRPRASSPIP